MYTYIYIYTQLTYIQKLNQNKYWNLLYSSL